MKHNGNEQNSSYLQAGFALGVLYASNKEKLNAISAQTGGEVSGRLLAFRMGEILLAEANGKSLGIADILPPMRRITAKGGSIPEPLEMVGSARDDEALKPKRVMSKTARKKIAAAQKKRWRLDKAKRRAEEKTKKKAAWVRSAEKMEKADKKKLHWTQTPKGRAYMRKSARKRFHKKPAVNRKLSNAMKASHARRKAEAAARLLSPEATTAVA